MPLSMRRNARTPMSRTLGSSPDEPDTTRTARIEGLRLPEQGRFKQYYTLVTDCLRAYLEQPLQIHTFDRTTAELKVELHCSTLSQKNRAGTTLASKRVRPSRPLLLAV